MPFIWVSKELTRVFVKVPPVAGRAIKAIFQ